MPSHLPESTGALLYCCAGAVAVGILPMPYGYYMFLRFAAVIAFGVVTYAAYKSQSWSTLVISLCAALVMNPIVPLHLSKEAWAPIDGAAAAYLAVVTKQVTTGFSNYGPPELSAEAVAKALGFSVLLGLSAGVGLSVIVGVLVIPLKWFGLSISGKFMNSLAYGAAAAAATAVLSGYAYYTGNSARARRDA